MGKGRKIEHLLPSIFNYARLSPSSSDSLEQPLLLTGCEHNEIEALGMRITELDKEAHRLRSDLSELRSQLAYSSNVLLPPKVHSKTGEEEAREIKELKFRVSKLEFMDLSEPLVEKQKKAMEKLLRENNAAVENKITQLIAQVADLQKLHRDQKEDSNGRTWWVVKKITKLTAQVAELKPTSPDSVMAPATSSDVLPEQKPEGHTEELIGCLVVLIFLISVLIGLNI
ncbi:hypothetical protein SAY86_025773 [Trapa natans]|uniref:Uncharacterized protein n=1 Tax=Trapa natans TaxID=22666 RepID=A0AAN7K9R8_TRANT|nr:hypothetical protein SAY86_025773 [Trapa natans]